jgi:hypothetical protein
MPRYFTRPTVKHDLTVRADDYWADAPPYVTNLTVCDHEATDTGLLDANGDCIMRAPTPMGFGRDDEW